MTGGADRPQTFPADAVHLVRTTQQAQGTLSQMADQKASMLLAATFVIFTITVGQARDGRWPPVPLMVLGGFAFAAALCAILVVLPSVGGKPPPGAEGGNLLFFGTFAKLDQDEFVERLFATLHSEDAIYRTMAIDIYQNGRVLARKKYRMLRHAYRLLLLGLVLSLAIFVGERLA